MVSWEMSFTHSVIQSFVESFLGYLRGTIVDTVPTLADSQSMLDDKHLEFKSHDFWDPDSPVDEHYSVVSSSALRSSKPVWLSKTTQENFFNGVWGKTLAASGIHPW